MRLFFVLMVFPLFSAYVGNPAEAAIMNTGLFSSSYPFFKFTSGYIYDYTPNKRYSTSDQMIKRFGLHSQQANASLILVERLQLYASAGGSKEIVEEEPIYDTILDTHTRYHFSWSLGGRVILLQWWKTYLGADFCYFNIPSSHKSFFKYLNRMNLPLETEKHKFSLDEWQLNLGLASRLFFLTPYAGINYLHSRLHADTNYQMSVNWGYFYGLTLSLTGQIHLNFERRVRNEFGYTFATTAVF